VVPIVTPAVGSLVVGTVVVVVVVPLSLSLPVPVGVGVVVPVVLVGTPLVPTVSVAPFESPTESPHAPATIAPSPNTNAHVDLRIRPGYLAVRETVKSPHATR